LKSYIYNREKSQNTDKFIRRLLEARNVLVPVNESTKTKQYLTPQELEIGVSLALEYLASEKEGEKFSFFRKQLSDYSKLYSKVCNYKGYNQVDSDIKNEKQVGIPVIKRAFVKFEQLELISYIKRNKRSRDPAEREKYGVAISILEVNSDSAFDTLIKNDVVVIQM
jgi:hypothetical protein